MQQHSLRYALTPLFLAFGLILAMPAIAQAQSYDTKGKSFWVSFIENFTSTESRAQLALYLSCDRPASVTISYLDNGHSITVPLNVPNTVVEVDIDDVFGEDTELNGADAIGTEITRRSYHITASEDITVYGLSLETYSCDAFLVYPEDVLSEQHVVLAYQNMPEDTANGMARMPSEFAILATTNNTNVEIRPQARINGRADMAPIVITLNRGEVFFGQAWEPFTDVSGTLIDADRPVAVFSGIARTGVPTQANHGRDVLIEQMLPTANWGREVILTPFYPVTPSSPFNSYARITPLYPGTTWTLDGVAQGTLSQGRPIEIEVSRPMVVAASGPILVAQYEHSISLRDTATSGSYTDGDPFMMLAVPSEQFDTAYTFQSVTHRDLRSHFINVVIPTDAVGTLRLDDKPPLAVFRPVPGTSYSYAQIELQRGSHHIGASAPFGLYAYGYGGAISYGYVGGMLFRPLVRKGEVNVLCNELTGYIYDNQREFVGIDSIYFNDRTSNVNTRLIAGDRTDTVYYGATLLDPYNDGIVGMNILYSNGRLNTYLDTIPGFTVRAAGMQAAGRPIALDTVAVFDEVSFCRKVTLQNYGAFPRTVEQLTFSPHPGDAMTVNAPLPLTLAPGDVYTIELCFQGQLEHDMDIRLTIADSCLNREIVVIPLIIGVDTTAPGVDISYERCDSTISIAFDEGAGFYSGIAELKLELLVNCDVEFVPFTSAEPARVAQVRVIPGDPREDAIYRISARDALGNVQVISDTIGGFTLSIYDRAGDVMAVRLNRDWDAGRLVRTYDRCDSVELHNYGLLPLQLDRAYLVHNMRFSIPPSQFPMVIPPKSSIQLQVCMDGFADGTQLDTLALDWGCNMRELLALKMNVQTPQGRGEDNCGIGIEIVPFAPTKRTFLMVPVPNPTPGGQVHIDMGLAQDEVVRLEVFDAQGVPVESVLRDAALTAGIHRFSFDALHLPSGEYFFRMTTASGEVLVEKLQVRR